MAIHSQTFAIITCRLIVKCWKEWNIPTKFEKNLTKPGNPYYLVLFENRTKPGTILSETVLSRDPLYYNVLTNISMLGPQQWASEWSNEIAIRQSARMKIFMIEDTDFIFPIWVEIINAPLIRLSKIKLMFWKPSLVV